MFGIKAVFEPKQENIMGSRRKMHNEEPHNSYCSPDIIMMINVTCMGKMRNAYKISVGKYERKNYLGDPHKDGKIILKWS
jgi:hypothetical protein